MKTVKLRQLWELVKFSASSLSAFAVDYGLFCLLSAAGFGITAANVSSRAVSSVFNFTLNRRLVFKDKGPLLKSAAGYFSLAAVILLLNTLVLKALTLLGINRLAAKLMTEILLFTLSFTVQKLLIFRRSKEQA